MGFNETGSPIEELIRELPHIPREHCNTSHDSLVILRKYPEKCQESPFMLSCHEINRLGQWR